MVQARVRGRVIVKTAFPLGQRHGHVFTSGRHGRGQAELFLEGVPAEARAHAVGFLESFAAVDFKERDTVVEGGGVFVLAALTRDAKRHLLATSLRGLPKRARLLELRMALPRDRYANPDDDAFVEQFARDMLARPCSGCGGLCDCGGDRFLSSTYRGDEVFTGRVATPTGVFKEHADGSRHKMDATEFFFDDAIYEPMAPVPGELFPGVAHRGTPELERTLPAVEKLLKCAEDEDGATTSLLPVEVRAGDVVFRTGAVCDDPTCFECHQRMDVLAVHHDGRGIVVFAEGMPAPFRVKLDTIVGSIRGPHWEEGDGGEEGDEDEMHD